MSELEGCQGAETDPELWLAIFRRCQKLGPALAEPVLAALDELHPELVLETYFKVLATDCS